MPSIAELVTQNSNRLAQNPETINSAGFEPPSPLSLPPPQVTGLPVRGYYPQGFTLDQDFGGTAQITRTGPNMRSPTFPVQPSTGNIKITVKSPGTGAISSSSSSSSSSLLLETNGMKNTKQNILNFLSGLNILVTSDSSGNETISTIDPSFQSIITNIALTAQTASISATNLIAAPSSTGLYYIAYFLDTTTAGSAGTALLTMTWSDGAAQSASTSTIALATLGSYVSGNLIVKATSGAIQYATTVAGATGSPQYSLDLRVIPLG